MLGRCFKEKELPCEIAGRWRIITFQKIIMRKNRQGAGVLINLTTQVKLEILFET